MGPRPIDLHIKAFKNLGVSIEECYGLVSCRMRALEPRNVHLDFPSVGATENVMLLSALSDGVTTISNAAKEPEIEDLQNFLNSMGCRVAGAGGSVIRIDGVSSLHDVEHYTIPDRIAAATFMSAAAITGGDVLINNIITEHMQPVVSVFEDMDCKVKISGGSLRIFGPSRIKSIPSLRTLPHPGFPTDAQAPVAAALTLADGTSIIAENIFDSRFKYLSELSRMGANVKVDGRIAVICGVDKLYAADITAGDLRGSASLVIAALAADGVTKISSMEHIERGYFNFDEDLRKLGADVKREN